MKPFSLWIRQHRLLSLIALFVLLCSVASVTMCQHHRDTALRETPPLVVTETPFQFGRFGRVRLFHPTTPSPPVILLVSDRNGWNPTGTAVAHNLASHGAIVVGVDLQHYTHLLRTSREWCSYPGGDFDALSKFVQKKLTLQEYELPTLIGYGAGAALVYSVLAQAPPNLFHGALSVGFCPALQISPHCANGMICSGRRPHNTIYTRSGLRPPFRLHG